MTVKLRFLRSLLVHKWWVFIAGIKVGDISWWSLFIHDWQKFTPSEFSAYANYFEGEKTETSSKDFMYAWIHHVGYGPHHWEYWMLNPKYNFSDAEDGKLPMPKKYVREMVADWMGASKAYTKSWNMCGWLNKNYDRIDDNLHDVSSDLLSYVLFELGYDYNFDIGWYRK